MPRNFDVNLMCKWASRNPGILPITSTKGEFNKRLCSTSCQSREGIVLLPMPLITLHPSQADTYLSQYKSSKYLHLVSALHHLGDYLWEPLQDSDSKLMDVPTIVKKIIFLFRVKNLHRCEQIGGRAVGREQVSSVLLMVRLQWLALMKDRSPWIDVIVTELASDLIPCNVSRPAQMELELEPEVEVPRSAPWHSSSCSLWKHSSYKSSSFSTASRTQI